MWCWEQSSSGSADVYDKLLGSVNDVVLTRESAAAMISQFAIDESPSVRAEIAKTFALASLKNSGRDELLARPSTTRPPRSWRTA